VTLLLVANVINLGADLGAMGSALKLMIGGPAHFYTVVFGAASVAAAILVPYSKYARLLKWSALVLLVYVATASVVHVHLRSVLANAFIPTISISTGYMTSLTAVFGTTISPYLFVWQASQEVQEQRAALGETALKRAPEQADSQLGSMRIDTYAGMAFSNLIAFFIILDTAAVLHAHGRTDIQTAAQAAEALRPLAGDLSFMLFSLGIVGTGLLAVPVLAGSAAYALAETLKWPIGLERNFLRAKGFYGTLAVATLIGLALNFTSIDPLRALFWSAVINGVVAVPFMFVMMLMTANPKVTGSMRLPLVTKVIGWISTAIMAVVAIGMIATWNR
jgi:Mn2+/Fe2+ NRAMP family transporter